MEKAFISVVVYTTVVIIGTQCSAGVDDTFNSNNRNITFLRNATFNHDIGGLDTSKLNSISQETDRKPANDRHNPDIDYDPTNPEGHKDKRWSNGLTVGLVILGLLPLKVVLWVILCQRRNTCLNAKGKRLSTIPVAFKNPNHQGYNQAPHIKFTPIPDSAQRSEHTDLTSRPTV